MFDYLIFKEVFLIFILLMNLVSYFVYYLDKKRAQQRQARISEKNLFAMAFFFGGLGAWLAMSQFRHKTQKKRFKYLIPLTAIWTLISFYFVFNH